MEVALPWIVYSSHCKVSGAGIRFAFISVIRAVSFVVEADYLFQNESLVSTKEWVKVEVGVNSALLVLSLSMSHRLIPNLYSSSYFVREVECKDSSVKEIRPATNPECKSPVPPVVAPVRIVFSDIFVKWPLSCIFSKSEECWHSVRNKTLIFLNSTSLEKPENYSFVFWKPKSFLKVPLKK